MKKILFLMFLNIGYFLFSQVGIGTSTPRGALDINRPTTNTFGLVLPTNTSTANIQNPQGGAIANATMIYDTTNDCIRIFNQNTWSNCLLTESGSSYTISKVEQENTFNGLYKSNTVLTTSNNYVVGIKNDSPTAVSITLSTLDLKLSGVKGISVSSVSPSNLSIQPGQTAIVTYTLSGTPQDCGTLVGTWKKINLTHTATINVISDLTFNCTQGYWSSPVTPEYRLNGLVPGQSYSGTYTIPYIKNGTGESCDLPPEIITNRGLTLTFPGGPISDSGTITYTLSGTYTGPADSRWALFTNASGCQIYLGPCSTCKEILQVLPDTPSGVYTINPDKQVTTFATMSAQCDMTTDGGGWTLMANYAVSYAAQPLAYSTSDGLPTSSFRNKLPIIGTETLGVNEVGNTTTFGSGSAMLNGFIQQPTEWRVSGIRSNNNSTTIAQTINWKAPMTTAIRNSMIANSAFTTSTAPTPLPGNTVTPTVWGSPCCSGWGGRRTAGGLLGYDTYGFWIGYLQLHRTNDSGNPNASRDNAIYRLWIR